MLLEVFLVSIGLIKPGVKYVVGLKQTAKAIQKNNAEIVILAKDADQRVIEGLIAACKAGNVEFKMDFNMQEIGKACNIQVGAAAAAILKQG